MNVPFLKESEIENTALNLLLRFCGDLDNLGVDRIPVEAICENYLKLDIVPGNLKKDFPEIEFNDAIGALSLEDEAIYVDLENNFSKTRERFTIAHEVGHYELHRNLLGKNRTQQELFTQPSSRNVVICREGNSGRPEEWQANKFAAALLMPKPILTDYVKKIRKARGLSDFEPFPDFQTSGQPDITAFTSMRFCVSNEAARIRLENLGIIEKKELLHIE